MAFFLNCECAVINATVKLAFLSFTVIGSMDHGLPYSFWNQYGTWTSTWSLVAVQIMDIKMALCCSMGHRHYHGPLQQHRTQTSTWPPGYGPWTPMWTPAAVMISDCSSDHRHQYSPQSQHLIMGTFMALAGSICHRKLVSFLNLFFSHILHTFQLKFPIPPPLSGPLLHLLPSTPLFCCFNDQANRGC